jgi:hypothetical protein
MNPERDPVEGRARRTRPLLLAAAALAVVAALPFVSRAWSADVPPARAAAPTGPTRGLPDGAGATVSAPRLSGVLVYTTFETEGFPDRQQQQLMVLDLTTGAVSAGPLVPSAEELWVGADGTLVLVADDAGSEGVAYAIGSLSPDALAVEIIRGDVLSLSSSGDELLAGRTGPAAPGSRCEDRAYDLATVDLGGGGGSAAGSGCGELASAVHHVWPVVTTVRDGRPRVEVFDRPSAPSTLFPDLAVLSVSPIGTFLFADPEEHLQGLGVWPRTPTGPLLVWPSGGTPRPLVDGRLFAQRVVAWSADGSDVVIAGIVRDERNLFRVYVPTGAVEALLPPNSFPLRSAFSGATFDAEGNAYAGAPGAIVVSTRAGVFPVRLPAEAPSPVGPVAWLPAVGPTG